MNPVNRQLTLALFLFTLCGAQAQLRVPAFTAYLEPDPDGARVSPRSGVSDWTDPSIEVLWFGEIKTPGKLDCSLLLRLPAGAETRLRLTVAGKSTEASAKGTGDDSVRVDFGSFDVPAAGYQRFTLESLNAPGQAAGNLEALLLVADKWQTFLISGSGDVIDPDEDLAAIGSGGSYATAAARALMENTDLGAREIAEKAMKIAADICIYTNDHILVEELK